MAEFILTPAIGDNFIGRDKLVRELVEELHNKKSHIGFCLYGRRRVGKTSILIKVRQLLEEDKKLVVAYLSLYDIADLSPTTLAEELMDAIVRAYQEKGLLPLKIRIKDLLKSPLSIASELLKSVKVEGVVAEHIKLILEFKKERGDDGNYSEYIRQAFNTGEVLARSTSTKCIIILDEFPEVVKFKNGLQLVKMLRTQYELQRATAIIISGSIKRTLDIVALSEGSPFYKQLVPKHLLPFTEQETAEFIKSYIGKVGKKEAEELYDITSGLPFYLQFIGRSTKYSGEIKDIIDTFIAQEGDLFFREEFEKLSDKEKIIVAALANGTENLVGIAKSITEPATTVSRYLPNLIEDDIVEKKSRGTYALADKLFAYWLKKRVVE